jgi:hypothetical protein
MASEARLFLFKLEVGSSNLSTGKVCFSKLTLVMSFQSSCLGLHMIADDIYEFAPDQVLSALPDGDTNEAMFW